MGLIFAGVDLFDEYGITADSSQTWVKPERDREFVHVPGRNGDLILDRGSWENVEIEYNCHMDDNFATAFEDFVKWLSGFNGYAELDDEHHPDVYRLATPELAELEPETTFTDQTADFTLVFNCKPQQWLRASYVKELDFTSDDAYADMDEGVVGYEGFPLVTIFAPTTGARISVGLDQFWDIKIAPFVADRIVLDFETGNAVLQDEMGEYVGNGNPYVTVTPPSAFAPDFPDSNGSITFFHEDPDDATLYTGTAWVDPRFWRI